MKLHHALALILLFMFQHSLRAAELDAVVGWADVRQLGVPITAQVNKVNSAAGSYVKAGDTMVSLSCGIYKARLLQQQALSAGLLPAVETALKEKELADDLFERTVLSEVEHRNAELLYIKAKSDYESSLAIVEQAKLQAGYCELKADSALLILKVHVMSGEVYSLESAKPVLVTVASGKMMLASSKQALPLEKVYSTGLPVKVAVAGKQYSGQIQSVNYLADNSVIINATFDAFDPKLLANNTAKIIVQ
ncbi:MAG: hypothetical protein OEY29_13535 [Gammaproteobacteria bacterium]|nr:hypothetical protein [Gammaproteobacteria bacterium]